MGPFDYDAVIIGAGPNGLAAAITLAKAGCSVLVVEARATPGGGARTAAITLPGFAHDICSSVHPLGAGSPFLRSLPLEEHGLSWIHSPALLAHPFDYGPPVMLERSLDATCARLRGDAGAYRSLIEPFSGDHWGDLADAILGPLRVPRHPILMARFGLYGLRSARGLVEGLFRDERTRALFAGMACHSMLPLDEPPSAAFGLVLAAAGHTSGWPIARGGSQAIIEALCSYLSSIGGVVVTGRRISSMDDLPPARAYLFDVTPRQLLQIAGNRLPSAYRRDLRRYRYGPGAFKLDYALDAPIPWRAPECARACTVHLGGHTGALAASESASALGRIPERPYVIVVQPTLFDPSRAPEGKHVAWVYCHVPHGSRFDMTERIEAQIERFAPGFRDIVLERRAMTPVDFERYNPNYVGGDINGGLQDLGQLFTRPRIQVIPYSTPVDDIFLCSSSMPPGGGVHGMCGFWAARAVLAKLRGEVEGELCGGFAGIACDKGLFCSFAPEASCGAGDQSGVCAWMPDACTHLYDPVCGCDGQTYGNACQAASNGVSVASEGECAPIAKEGESCGGFVIGAPPVCADGLYCHYAPEDTCGFADAPGTCAQKPDFCTKEYNPVCGCDGQTYGNACEAAASGTSVLHEGECQ